MDPVSQFTIKRWLDLDLFGIDASVTNSTLSQILAVVIVIGFIWFSVKGRYETPNRAQALVEISYEFIEGMVRSSAGPEAMKFFPLIFSLFLYILLGNLLGLIPGMFTFTSHIIVTAAMALFVMTVITIFGFYRNGFKFFKLFAPSGVPAPMLILLIPLEMISYLVRPFSLSVRLAVNMVAGHMIVKIFASFVILLGVFGPFPFVVLIGITALELLVAFLQAYVFAILISVYLHDAIHPAH